MAPIKILRIVNTLKNFSEYNSVIFIGTDVSEEHDVSSFSILKLRGSKFCNIGVHYLKFMASYPSSQLSADSPIRQLEIARL